MASHVVLCGFSTLFLRRVPHDAADGLDDIDDGVPGIEEDDGIQHRDIHAFG